MCHFHGATGPAPGCVKEGAIKSALSARTTRKESPVKRIGSSAISLGPWRNRGKSPPRQTTLFQCHNRGKGRPISDAIGAAVPTSKVSNGGKSPYTACAEDTAVGVFHSPMALKIPMGREAIVQIHISPSAIREGVDSGTHELSATHTSSGERGPHFKCTVF